MKAKQLEKWIWILLYGGLLILALGLATQPADSVLGTALVVAGLVSTALSLLFFVIRCRMKEARD